MFCCLFRAHLFSVVYFGGFYFERKSCFMSNHTKISDKRSTGS